MGAEHDQDFRMRVRRCEQAGPPEKELWVYLEKWEQPRRVLTGVPFFKTASVVLFGSRGAWLVIWEKKGQAVDQD